MMVMPANNSAKKIMTLADKYPGRLGWLIGPTARRKTRLRSNMPFALDNDAFTAWKDGTTWDEAAWMEMLELAKFSGLDPLWVLVPDVVADRNGTLEMWGKYSPAAKSYGWPLAFAVQDGMAAEDVPNGAEIVFVGGTTFWKWNTLPTWTTNFPRVHVGRVNEARRILTCERLGVESVDGTGWFRDGTNGRRVKILEAWLSDPSMGVMELL